MLRKTDVYERLNAELSLVPALNEDDQLEGRFLRGFSARVGEFFQGIPG